MEYVFKIHKKLPANCTKSTKMEGVPKGALASGPPGDGAHSPTISVENTMEWEKEGEKIVKKSKLPLTKAASSCKIRRSLENGRRCGFAPLPDFQNKKGIARLIRQS